MSDLVDKNIIILIPNIQDRAASTSMLALTEAGYIVWGGVTEKKFKSVKSLVSKCNKIMVHPDASNEHSMFKKWLIELLANNDDLIVLPVNEAVVFASISISNTMAFDKRFVMPSKSSLNFSLSKYQATKAAKEAGLCVPVTKYIKLANGTWGKHEALSVHPKQILKWDNGLSVDGKYVFGSNVSVSSLAELEEVCAELNHVKCNVILQKMVPGYGCGAFVFRYGGRTILRFSHRRLHEVPWTGGTSSLAEPFYDQEVLDAAERLLDFIEYEGVAMVEFRKEVGKPPVFLEINGRLWGSIGLALGAGFNFPLAMIECHLHGETLCREPSVINAVRWREPSLEMEYVKSLWTTESPIGTSAPRMKGVFSVLWNMVNLRTSSDWSRYGSPIKSMQRSLGLIRREMAWAVKSIRQSYFDHASKSLVNDAVFRTEEMLANASTHPPKKIVFLCFGNICRSPYAEIRWNQWRRENSVYPEAVSAGIHDRAGRQALMRFKDVARYRGVDMNDHRSIVFSPDVASEADWIICMDDLNLVYLNQRYPEIIGKTMLLGACVNDKNPVIVDPYGQRIPAGTQCYRQIDRALEKMKNSLSSFNINAH